MNGSRNVDIIGWIVMLASVDMLIFLYFSVEEVALIIIGCINLSWSVVLAYLVERGITSLETSREGEKVTP